MTLNPSCSNTVDGLFLVTSTTPTCSGTPPGPLASADDATEHGKGAHFFIEEAAEKNWKTWHHVVP